MDIKREKMIIEEREKRIYDLSVAVLYLTDREGTVVSKHSSDTSAGFRVKLDKYDIITEAAAAMSTSGKGLFFAKVEFEGEVVLLVNGGYMNGPIDLKVEKYRPDPRWEKILDDWARIHLHKKN